MITAETKNITINFKWEKLKVIIIIITLISTQFWDNNWTTFFELLLIINVSFGSKDKKPNKQLTSVVLGYI